MITYLHIVKFSDTFSLFILPDFSAAFVDIVDYFLLFETFFFTFRTQYTAHEHLDAVAFFYLFQKLLSSFRLLRFLIPQGCLRFPSLTPYSFHLCVEGFQVYISNPSSRLVYIIVSNSSQVCLKGNSNLSN